MCWKKQSYKSSGNESSRNELSRNESSRNGSSRNESFQNESSQSEFLWNESSRNEFHCCRTKHPQGTTKTHAEADCFFPKMVGSIECLVFHFWAVRGVLNFAVTSGLRREVLAESARDTNAVLTGYEDFKCSHKDILALCRAQGISFLLMVMEASGGWGKMARCV